MSFAHMVFGLALLFEFKEIHLGDERCTPFTLIVCICGHVSVWVTVCMCD